LTAQFNVDLGETGNVVIQVQWSDEVMQIATKCLENMSLPHQAHEMNMMQNKTIWTITGQIC